MPITTLGKFIDAVEKIVQEWTPPDADWYPSLWFRGHGSADWKLQPGQYRLPPPDDGVGSDWYNERTLISEFKFRAPLYLPSSTAPQTDWEWLFLMQHYGLPTRLLDWTESSLIGLYFALRDNPGNTDAAVWVLNPWWLNKQSLREFEIPHAEDAKLAKWSPPAEGQKLRVLLPVALKPVQANARIRAQKGYFTVHGTEKLALHSIAQHAGKKAELREIRIAATDVAGMKRDLTIAGISETTIFPDMDGLCREIKAWFY